MIIPSPMPLVQQTQPFDDPNWIYEIKHDGFRAMAVFEHGQCRFFSRKKHRFTGYQELREALVKEVTVESVILDGELAVTDHLGRTTFADMMKRRRLARFFAFDIIWLNGEDLRALPLLTRKEKLRRILPTRSAHVLYVDHAKRTGQLHSLWELFPELKGTSVERELRQVIEDHAQVSFEFSYPKDQRWYETTGYPASPGAILIIRDITTKKSAH